MAFSGYNHNNNKRHLGFALTTSPKEIVCRTGATRVVLLPEPPDGSYYEFTTTDSAVVKIQEIAGKIEERPANHRMVELTGGKEGQATVTANLLTEAERLAGSTGRGHDSIRVFVYAERIVKVNFIRVIVPPGRGSTTRLQSAHIPELVKLMNGRYFKYQANIVLSVNLNTITALPPNVDLTTQEQSEAAQQPIYDWMLNWRNANDPAPDHAHVFLVNKWSARDTVGGQGYPNVKDVYGAAVQNCCIVEDLITLEAQALITAHELCHALSRNVGHDARETPNPLSLMAPTPTLAHEHLYPVWVRRMRGAP